MTVKKMLSLLLSVLLLLGVLPAAGLTASAEGETPINTENITQFGRNYVKDDVLYLYWTNSGFAFRFNGTGATATLTADNLTQIYLGYLHVYVDGEFSPSKTICLSKNSDLYVLAENLPAGEHTIEVRKRNEAKYGGSATIGVKTLDITGGAFLAPPAAKEKTVEFIGDSITSGFGNMVSEINEDPDRFTTEFEDGTMTYAVLAAKALGAEAHVLSRSGIRFVYSNEKLDKQDSWYPHYENTATLPDNTSCADKWDFTAHKNDVVVINLGTNDNGAKVDGKTISDEEMTKDAVSMLKLIRKNNPDAVIIWTYGVMGSGRKAALSAAVDQVKAAGDDKVFYLGLANLISTTEGIGTHGHPSMQTHINRSMDLAAFIAEKTGWDCDYGVTMQAQIQWSSQYNTKEVLANYTALSAANFQSAMKAGAEMQEADDAEWKAAIEKIQSAYLKLVSTEDMAKDYTIVDTFDDRTGWSIAGESVLDTVNQKQGSACFSTSGPNGSSNSINFMRTNAPLNIQLPENWENWYVEFWMYVDKPENIPGGSCLELSQVVDQTEVQWGLDSLGLQAGWNKVQLRMGSGSLSGKESFKTLQNIRIFVVNMKDSVTIKVDDMVLAKGKAAADITTWQEQMTAAEEMLKNAAGYSEAALAPVKAAYEAAGAATTQRDVDVTAENLKNAMEAVAGNVEAAEKVDALIEALPEKPTAADRSAVEAARAAYEALTDAQKALVTKLADLEAAEKALPKRDLGDINNDGKVDTTDARLALQYAVGKIPLDDGQLGLGDVNADGKVDTTDARLILQKAVGKIDQFPAGK